MELTLSPNQCRNTLHLAMTAASQPLVGSAATNEGIFVIWATTPFAYSIGKTPSTVKPVAGTLGDRTWPAGIPLRVVVPKGFSISALALSGTGDLYAIPEA